MGTSAEEAIARARAIAARLAGTAAVASTTAAGSAAPVPAPPPQSTSAASAAGGGGAGGGTVMVDAATAKAAEEALAMAFGPSGGTTATTGTTSTSTIAGAAPEAEPAPTSSKRKRWGADDGASPAVDGIGGLEAAAAAKRAALDPSSAASSTAASASTAATTTASETADLAQQALMAALGAATANDGRVTRKLPIPTAQYPGYNFVGLLIGPGGSKQRELVQRAGGNVKISVRGDAASGGVEGEDGLHVFLEGSKECVDKADEMISELLRDPKKADEEKARQLGGLKGAMGSTSTTKPAAGVDGQYGPAAATSSGSTYTPKPVASLLGLSGVGGSAQHYGPKPGSTTVVEEKIGVPNGVVGYIIGRGGESIISMQRRSNCKVQIQKEFEMEPGSTQRVITLTADSREAIDAARGIIEAMVKEKMVENGGGGVGGGGVGGGGSGGRVGGPGLGAGGMAGMDPQTQRLNQAIADGHHLIKLQVPNGDVGLIIGRGGSQIKMIQDRSGANVQIPQAADADNPAVRTISITHPNQPGAEFAKTMITDILKEKAQRQAGGGATGGVGGGIGALPPGSITIQVHIPDRDVGLCIGKQGSVIKAMQTKTGCRINIPAQPTPGLGYRICTVSGPPDKCQEVQGIIQRISAEQSSNFLTGGMQFQQQQQYGFGGHYGQQAAYGQQPLQPQGGDNSAAWAAYYAAQAATGAPAPASASVAQAASPAPASTSAPSPAAGSGDQPAADAYYDAFFRYAAYYGEDAARKYYGAWSPPAGTPNPYGNASPDAAAAAVAQNGAAAAPSAGAAPAPSPASAVAPLPSTDSTSAKDSSVRRGVSNLPAWMTNK